LLPAGANVAGRVYPPLRNRAFPRRTSKSGLTVAADLSRQGHVANRLSDADILIVEVSNRGVSRIIVTGAYWRVGWLNPEIVAVFVPNEHLPVRIESRHGVSFPIALNDMRRALIAAVRERTGPVALIVRTTTGDDVRCQLTRDARQWISWRGA